MIDRQFLKKKIEKITVSYVHDPDLLLTEKQIDTLIKNFHEQRLKNPDEDIHHILHDVIYEYLTVNYF
ncbi:YqzH family protein [Alkalihalobacillus sp. BA299]|uniref:YqzH family protein n=1 Tax=Alkalihalobacillus sp. BA299 TaxID=2815938 RepID=UPI001ADC62EF|nr:YqzH family protein [Alkalihalobacillus sp. BA299]